MYSDLEYYVSGYFQDAFQDTLQVLAGSFQDTLQDFAASQ